jgi:hypothetical protein
MALNKQTKQPLVLSQSLEFKPIWECMDSSSLISPSLRGFHLYWLKTGLTTIFNISYLVAEAPANWLLQTLRPGRALIIILVFGYARSLYRLFFDS